MKTIEINTAQKVTIQYELASVGNRFLAFFIDMLILLGVEIFLGILGAQAFDSYEYQDVYMFYAIFIMLPIALFYTFASETLMDGQTIGKRAMGIKVVKLNGDTPTAHDYFIRWVFRGIDIFASLGSVAALLISASAQNQRIGGILSGTTVIRITSLRTFTLGDILKISTIETYQPSYPQITKFNEKDMLFIKQVLERERRYKNDAHTEAVRLLSQHISKELDIINPPANPNEFLRTLINDYIVLTR